MYWVRVDNRLIHGQIIESWLPYTRARLLIVAHDSTAQDMLQQEIMGLAIPGRVKAVFLPVEDVDGYLSDVAERYEKSDVLVLFASCKDAKRALESGLRLMTVNIGNLHYSPGKKQVCANVALSDDDISCLRYFKKKGVELDFRCVPNEPIQVKQSW